MYLRSLPIGCALATHLLLLSGCAHIGPQTIVSDRFDYSAAIGTSWKEQTLLNIVKIRNADLPVFVDVSSVVSGYSLETKMHLGGTISSDESFSPALDSTFTDRPTITYTPMTGEKFLRGLINPIDPTNIFSLIQAGYPADFILGLSVESINGLRNRTATAYEMRAADPDFGRVLLLLRELQSAGAVGMRVEDLRGEGGPSSAVFFRDKDMEHGLIQKSEEVRRLLKLEPGRYRFRLIYSPVPGDPDELAVRTRSILQIMTAFASYIEESDKGAKRNAEVSTATPDDNAEGIHIHSGPSAPKDAYARVQYKGRWYWIEDGDFLTKRALSTIILMFTLADTGGTERLPVITIPAQ